MRYKVVDIERCFEDTRAGSYQGLVCQIVESLEKVTDLIVILKEISFNSADLLTYEFIDLL